MDGRGRDLFELLSPGPGPETFRKTTSGSRVVPPSPSPTLSGLPGDEGRRRGGGLVRGGGVDRPVRVDRGKE